MIKTNNAAVGSPIFMAKLWFNFKEIFPIGEIKMFIQDSVLNPDFSFFKACKAWITNNQIPQHLEIICFDLLQRINRINLGELRAIQNDGTTTKTLKQLVEGLRDLKKNVNTVVELVTVLDKQDCEIIREILRDYDSVVQIVNDLFDAPAPRNIFNSPERITQHPNLKTDLDNLKEIYSGILPDSISPPLNQNQRTLHPAQKTALLDQAHVFLQAVTLKCKLEQINRSGLYDTAWNC